MVPQPFEQIISLKSWSRGDEKAPHKPLLILYALGHWKKSRTEWISFAEIDKDLGLLLAQFGPSRQVYHTEYPFWRLQNDGLWRVRAESQLDVTASTDAKRSELLIKKAHGALAVEVLEFIKGRADGLNQIVDWLLNEYFQPSAHAHIRSAVGLN